MENNIEKGSIQKKHRITTSEYHATRILQRIHSPNLDIGGAFTLTTGAPGSAKTSVMLSFCDYAMRHHSKHKIFFSNGYGVPFQFSKLGKDRFDILVLKDSNVTFHDRTDRRREIFPKVIYFDDFEDCYEKAIPGRCSAVFFGDRDMQMDYLHYLLSVGEWIHVFIDEISEIAPAFTSGRRFRKIGQFALDLKEVRKCLVNYCCNSQSVKGIDHRVIAIIMVQIFLPGARTSKGSRVSQRAIDNLKIDPVFGNEGYIESYGNFGKTVFKNIYVPDGKQLWEARVNVKR